jgi:hypothetical protein
VAVLAILEQPDDAIARHPVAFDSRKLTQPKRSYPAPAGAAGGGACA